MLLGVGLPESYRMACGCFYWLHLYFDVGVATFEVAMSKYGVATIGIATLVVGYQRRFQCHPKSHLSSG
jgi:hypothetical protein